MTSAEEPIVVIGVGNVLLGDDGVGVRVVEELRNRAEADVTLLPPGTRLVDGGTLGLDLLRHAAGARGLLLVDGMDMRLAPGEIAVVRGQEIASAGSERDAALGELLAIGALMGWLPAPVALVGIQVADMGFSRALSPSVEAAVPRAVATALDVIHSLDADEAGGNATRADPMGATR